MRWASHRSELRRNIHSNKHLQGAWNIHGESAFTFAVLEECSRENLIEREQYWIDTICPFGDNGYNLSRNADVANRGRSLTEEHKVKLSESKKGRPSPKKGTQLSIEHRAKLSAARTGKKLTATHIANAAAAKRGKPQKPQTPEAKAAISRFQKGRPKAKQHADRIAQALEQSYIVTDPQGTVTLIKGLKRFCKQNNLTYTAMISVATGRRKHHRQWTVIKL